ncbi:MAG: penicillin-binding protein 1C [Pseudomonadota bacterium]
MQRGFLNILIAVVTLIAAMVLGYQRFDAWVARTELPPLTPETGTEVTDRHGALLRVYTVEDGRWRLAVTPGQVDPLYLSMLVTYEDRRFYQHRGVDLPALLRAAGQALRQGRVVSGGSTLTMQAARLLENSGTGRWPGKIRQIRLALALERHLTKDEILTLYLQLAPFGGNLEGVRAGALAWFGVEPRRLTADQAALLVALPQSPEARRPDRHPATAQAARGRVLDRAVRFGLLPEAEVSWARRARLPERRRPFPALAPHLSDRLRTESGSHVVTTLDADLQAALEDLAARAVAGQDARLSAALLVADHQTGEIRAAVGSPDYTDATRRGFVDMTRAVRSPGSTLKPLIYGMAFEAGLVHPESLIADRPVRFGRYAPQNFDGVFRGELSVRRALQASLNVPVVSLLSEIGPPVLMARLARAHIAAQLPEDGGVGSGGGEAGLAIALGGVGVTLEDLVTLYAALARGGDAVRLRATPGTRTDPGSAPRTLAVAGHSPVHAFGKAPGERRRSVLSPVAAWYVGDILAGTPPPATAPRRALAFKTGTSYGHRDAWALGYDGRHVVGVWLGRADGAPVPGAFGGDLAAPILFEAFQRMGRDPVPLQPPPPGALTVRRADLPAPLRRFAPGGALAEAEAEAPAIAFPPDGGALALMPDVPLIGRVERGTPPFTWLWNGRPVAVARYDREVELGFPGAGFGALTVIDASGQAARGQVEILD